MKILNKLLVISIISIIILLAGSKVSASVVVGDIVLPDLPAGITNYVITKSDTVSGRYLLIADTSINQDNYMLISPYSGNSGASFTRFGRIYSTSNSLTYTAQNVKSYYSTNGGSSWTLISTSAYLNCGEVLYYPFNLLFYNASPSSILTIDYPLREQIQYAELTTKNQGTISVPYYLNEYYFENMFINGDYLDLTHLTLSQDSSSYVLNGTVLKTSGNNYQIEWRYSIFDNYWYIVGYSYYTESTTNTQFPQGWVTDVSLANSTNRFWFEYSTVTIGNLITAGPQPSLAPTLTYTTVLNSYNNYDITLNLTGLTSNYYAKWFNYSTGESGTIESGTTEYLLENQLYFSNLEVIIYDNNENVISSTIIDLSSNLNTSDYPYIYLISYNKTTLNSVEYSYKNLLGNEKCGYSINGGTEERGECGLNEIPRSKSISMNGYITLKIYSSDYSQIYDLQEINLNFLTNMPYFTFNSYYDESLYGAILEINLNNYENMDLLYYSLDNVNWIPLTVLNYNKLTYFQNTTVYLKVVRDSETISMAKYNVIVDIESYEDTTNNVGGLIGIIKNAITSVSDIKELFSNMLNMTLKTEIGKIILISFVVAILILIIAIFKK